MLPPTRASIWRTVALMLTCVVAGLALWVVSVGLVLEGLVPGDPDRLFAPAMADLTLGLLGLPLLTHVQRKRSFGAALTLVVLAGVSSVTIPAAVYATVQTVVWHPWRRVAALVALWIVSGTLGELISAAALGNPAEPAWGAAAGLLFAAIALMIGWGARGRQTTLEALTREARAATREREAMAREQEALRARVRATERARIARDLHNAVSHEISVIALHAGALEYRTDLTGDQMRSASATIAEAARRAGTDLRQILDALRDPDAGVAQPADLRDLDELVAESRSQGSPVELRIDPGLGVGSVPAGPSRELFRVARECLRNAVRHAPGAVIHVDLTGNPVDGLTLECRNARSQPAPADGRGSGAGLLGLAEMAEALGGRWDVDATETQWRTRMWVPWPRSE